MATLLAPISFCEILNMPICNSLIKVELSLLVDMEVRFISKVGHDTIVPPSLQPYCKAYRHQQYNQIKNINELRLLRLQKAEVLITLIDFH